MRELSIDTDGQPKDRPYADEAEKDLPKAWRKGSKIDRPDKDETTVRVRLKVPFLFPSVDTPVTVTSVAGASIEDEPVPPSQGGTGI